MKFSTAPFAILFSLVAVTGALPNPEVSADASEVGKSVEGTLWNTNHTDVEHNRTRRRKGGGSSGSADEILSLGLETAISGIQKLMNNIKQDKADRSQFTQNLIAQLRSHNPSFNYVVCHTNHEVKWDGVKGKDWSHSHREFDIQAGGTIGFEVYNARSGEFTRKGDGGYLNWAYAGNVVKSDDGGKHLIFAKP